MDNCPYDEKFLRAYAYKLNEQYKWRKNVVLTPKEGKVVEALFAENDCANCSQFFKMIVRGELVVSRKEPDV